MAPDEDADRPLAPAEKRLLELLAVLVTDDSAAHAGFSAAYVRRARRQQDTRTVLLAGSGVLAAVAIGLVGLFPARETGPGTG